MTTKASDAEPNDEVRDADVADFLDVQPQLFGIAYRMLGSVAEAEDIVQDAWIRWQRADRRVVRNPAAFLTTTTTRLAINASTAAHVRRETYIGPWVPEPVDTSHDPSLGAERAEALELAVLMLLEKLSPIERAAYVLHEAFDYPYRQVAEVLEISEANARQLARRARQALESERSAPATPAVRRRLLETFVAAARNGDLAALERLFTDDVVARPDGGGRVRVARVELSGVARVTNYLDNVLRKYWNDATLTIVDVNGESGMLVTDHTGTPLAVVALDVTARGVERVFLVANPDKMRQFERRS
ncbi:sigma-70 family RNA polymerase sigma factor [Jiangella aurantiaca]|uniref:Sigma-70 family RNA polymerase sigma factor n=1 Tax=Jiangella aurantiaca TaxID=2530373 RepID=A0A4R5A1Z7_9ACTN|nr:RNA polymerase sigma factor SigJ [Jiangella aurantiaca]TDD64539.1 sigma-70 family RNA polymerase sigma factor [Jiangella aurantiaca]